MATYYTTEHPSGRDEKLDIYHSDAIERQIPRNQIWSFGVGVIKGAELAAEIDKEEENN
ncbi:MAG: hypothetical protein KA604_01145 [Candidatus Saccharimonas sp.]|jgi:hypothetical protein|nr:hypothetical protein [Candidatus Saccharimonas sp.]